MPTKNRLIFLKEKTGEFKLRTDLKSFGYDERQGQYYVVFNKGDKVLHYNPIKVDIAEFTRQLEPPFLIRRNSDGDVLFNVLGVREYVGGCNKGYRVSFENGEVKEYDSSYLTIEEQIDDYRSVNVWEYLNEVAKYNVIPIDDDKSVSLADKYAKKTFVAKNSLLEAYLNTDTYKNSGRNISAPIFPFGCNRSQYKAVRNALENNLSVIQGPPGTGKTQTILNIMANLLLEGKTMQIVSNNNSAVENVKEKLESEGLGFICAQLGRASNKQQFVESQSGEYPDMTSWELKNTDKAIREARMLSESLQDLYESQERLAICTEQLKEYSIQLNRFPVKLEKQHNHTPELLHKYILLCSRQIEKKHKLSWLTKLKLRLHRLPFGQNAMEELQNMLLSAKVKILEQQSRDLKEKVKDINEKNSRLRELSMLILKGLLFRRFKANENRTVFTADELYLRTRDFLKEYPVVLSTTFSATSNINPNYRFDYLIMDEASQVDIAAGALALSAADSAVIVGDLKQLPNVVDEHTEEIVSAIFAKYEIAESYRYSTNSFLSSICSLYPNIPQTLLREHYRCDPLIIGFCSKQFYNGELIPMKKGTSEFAPIRVVRTVRGNHARGNVNQRQVDSICEEIVPALEEQFTDIGIIAPYNKQVDAINSALKLAGKKYPAATVHKFQGRENDAIVLSTVDNQVKEFTDDPHLLNVAVSRAKKQFTLVVSADEQPESNIQDLIDYIEYYQGGRQDSQISSIFDLLYEDYTQELLNFYKTHKKVSEFDSENLTYWEIREVIKEHGSPHLSVVLHYPLKYLVTTGTVLTEEEKTYAYHSWTHVDFLVYDTVSHRAKLAVEVDGTQYHKTNSEQGRRDVIKDSVLKSIGLPLLRLSTAGSMEKEKISKALFGNNTI